MSPSSIASADRLIKVFGSHEAVSELSFEVAAGEVVGLLGANGAGKTTAIRMLLGLVAPTSGRVEVLGRPPDRATRRRTGYMPQGLGLYEDLSVAENLRFSAAAFGAAFTLDSDLENVSSVPVGRLPLGLRRRVAFAAALGHHPDLLVLDEPTSGVGPLGRAALWDTIRHRAEDGAGVVVTTHYMDEAEQCDRLIMMAEGRVVATGTAETIVAGHIVVEVDTDRIEWAAERLRGANLTGLPVGTGLRVVGTNRADVAVVLPELADRLRESPANLEEAFVAIAAGAVS